MKRKYDKNKDELSNIRTEHKQIKEANIENTRNNLSHNTPLHNNIPNSPTKPTPAVSPAVVSDADKIQTRRSLKEFFMGLATQIPIFGGLVMYDKLIDLEKKIDKINESLRENGKKNG
jgi:hypothetical protein